MLQDISIVKVIKAPVAEVTPQIGNPNGNGHVPPNINNNATPIRLDAITKINRTDMGMSKLVLARHGRRLAVTRKWREDPVLTCDPYTGRWIIESRHLLRELITETAGHCLEIVKGWEPKATNGDKQADLLKRKDQLIAFFTSIQNNSKRQSCSRVLEDHPSIQVDKKEWETRDYEIAFSDGKKLNLLTGEQGRILPSDRILLALPFPLPNDLERDVGESPPVQVITQIFEGAEDLLPYFRQAIFSTLLGRKDDKVFFYLQGDPDSGKTVLMILLRALMGEYAEVADFLVIQSFESGFEHRFTMKRFEMKRAMTIDETGEESKYIDSRGIKAKTSGFEIESEEKNCPRTSYRPKFTIWITSNNDPNLIKDDGAVKRRLRLFRLKRVFTLQEQRPEYKVMETWAPHLSDLFRWVWQARDEYWKHRLTNVPNSMEEAIDENSADNDWIGQMLLEICEAGDNYEVDLASLWSTSKEWITDNMPARSRMNRASFKRELRAKKFGIDRDNTVKGLKLKASRYSNWTT